MGTVESYFFDEDGAGVTVNSKRYVQSYNVSRPYLEASGINIHIVLTKGGATVYTFMHLWQLFEKCSLNT